MSTAGANELNAWENKLSKFLNDHPSDDGSHDLGHFRRVWGMAKSFSEGRKVDMLVILAACYLHDIVNYPKNDPRRSLSSQHAAAKAREILTEMGFPDEKLDHVEHCIAAHSFSAGIPCETEEAKLVQDADRMEALGAIGLARVFYTGGRMGTGLFDSEDPFAEYRELNDKKYSVDHFETKLFKLPKTMQTEAGREEAEKRAEVLKRYLEDLKLEL